MYTIVVYYIHVYNKQLFMYSSRIYVYIQIIQIHTHIHIYTYTYIYIYIHIYTHTYINIFRSLITYIGSLLSYNRSLGLFCHIAGDDIYWVSFVIQQVFDDICLVSLSLYIYIYISVIQDLEGHIVGDAHTNTLWQVSYEIYQVSFDIQWAMRILRTMVNAPFFPMFFFAPTSINSFQSLTSRLKRMVHIRKHSYSRPQLFSLGLFTNQPCGSQKRM